MTLIESITVEPCMERGYYVSVHYYSSPFPHSDILLSLTGLLSFMLSDEMTTGSVTSSDSHKRAFAARSHAWNLTQPKFKEAFPDYCTSTPIDLPNMGEKEKGKSDTPKDAPKASPSTSVTPNPLLRPGVTASNLGKSTLHAAVQEQRDTANEMQERRQAMVPSPSGNTPKPEESSRGVAPIAQGWAASWRSFIYEKWRICAFIAVAVLLSRFTTR
jgi:ubiquitin-conjugating enzyme E2 J2